MYLATVPHTCALQHFGAQAFFCDWYEIGRLRLNAQNNRADWSMITTKRVYDTTGPEDGKRFLVERLWPRGIKKAALHMDGWLKDLAPSDALRRWFNHDPAKWDEFRQRYFAELYGRAEAWRPLLEAARQGTVTLLYSSHNLQYNNAVALKEYLEECFKQTGEKPYR